MPVDVIIPAHNRVEWLRDCLLSVLAQTYRSFRLIVVDDGSTPPLATNLLLAEIIRDERVRLLAKPNGGPPIARNFGLDYAEAEYLLMLDSDDILEGDAIETMLNAAVASNAEFIAGAWGNFSTTPERRAIVRPTPRYSDPYANCVEQ